MQMGNFVQKSYFTYKNTTVWLRIWDKDEDDNEDRYGDDDENYRSSLTSNALGWVVKKNSKGYRTQPKTHPGDGNYNHH